MVLVLSASKHEYGNIQDARSIPQFAGGRVPQRSASLACTRLAILLPLHPCSASRLDGWATVPMGKGNASSARQELAVSSNRLLAMSSHRLLEVSGDTSSLLEASGDRLLHLEAQRQRLLQSPGFRTTDKSNTIV